MKRKVKCLYTSGKQEAECKGPEVVLGHLHCMKSVCHKGILTQHRATGMLNVVTSVYYCLTHTQESSAKLHHKLLFKNGCIFLPP